MIPFPGAANRSFCKQRPRFRGTFCGLNRHERFPRADASAHQVINCSLVLNTQLPRHACHSSRIRPFTSIVRTDPDLRFFIQPGYSVQHCFLRGGHWVQQAVFVARHSRFCSVRKSLKHSIKRPTCFAADRRRLLLRLCFIIRAAA